MKTLIYLIIGLLSSTIAFSQSKNLLINNFEVKESLTSNSKIAIIATDSLNNADEAIKGTYKFTINGFEQTLLFNDGVAIAAHPIDGSTFVYFKHKNQDNSVGKLYFLYKKDNKISPIKINGLLILIVAGTLLVVAYSFKKFITTFILLAITYSYFSFSKGLSIFQIIESALEVVKNIF